MSALPRSHSSEDPVQRWRSIAGASFLYSDAPRPEHCGVHTHDKVLVSFLLRGSIIEVDERAKKAECGPVTLHSSPPGMRHAHLIQSPRVTTLCFALESDLVGEMGDGGHVFDQPITTRGAAIALAPKFQREISATDSASDLVLRGLIFELVGELSRRGSHRLPPEAPDWLRRAREMINDTWNQNISMEEIAAAVGVHPSHLNRVFRAYMNQTPGEYLRHIRMTRATRDVLSGETPFKVIAAKAGFADQAHFTREFRRQHGMSPMEMRRAIRG
ncbi:MAG TPA: AraC family transcriptional regulator [Fimbriimonadaceae bacterium]|nr:AraC family transcriptional regulator [Fimbriimonadaceae bacterium]